jgi:hypothetical protein
MEVRPYISPFHAKLDKYEDQRRKYWNRVMGSQDYYDSFQNSDTRAEDKRQDFEDLHLQWSLYREEYAKGDDEALARMLGFVTETNPPEKSLAEMAAEQPAPPPWWSWCPIFRRRRSQG